MPNSDYLYGTWQFNETIDYINCPSAYINFTAIAAETEYSWDTIKYYMASLTYIRTENDNTFYHMPYTSRGWGQENYRIIKISSTTTNSSFMQWLQANAVKLSDSLIYADAKSEYKALMDELSDVINEKAGITGKKVLSEMVEAAKTIEKGITPTGTKEIMENNLYEVASYEYVNVNVPTGITPSGTYEVTDNGEYDITEYAKVNVNVAGSGSNGNMLQTFIDNNNNSCKYLFYYYSGSNIDYISDLDTSKVTDMSYMFFLCTALTTVPLLDTRKVTTMVCMFRDCRALTTVPQFDTSSLSNAYAMFRDCRALTTVPQFKITSPYQNADMREMFYGCTELTTIAPLIITRQTDMSYAFYNCKKLVSIDISLWDNYNSDYSSNMFTNCNSLKALIIRSIGSYSLNSNAFTGCYHLTGTVNATYNPNGDKDGYIYIPSEYVNKLKSATNWSAHADQIRALEDYTVDGTITGELDESKI